ncbi:MAG: hypothetical protein H6741_34500 [Alphaproteobacteria bacterium]|nr:hypothetical protein [Alphaproteobacteria bacterium]
MLPLLLMACVARDYVPHGPVYAPDAPARPDVRYTGPPRVQTVLPPLQAFGIRYDLDLVVVTDHPKWTMHELARVAGLGWFAKDADQARAQTIIAGLPDLEGFAAEVPAPRVEHPVEVLDRSQGAQLDLTFDYVNADGERVRIHAEGSLNEDAPRLRNTSTMGHSAQAVSAALDLFARHDTGAVQVSYDGVPARVERIAGAPIQAFIAQTQGGFAACSMALTPSEQGWQVRRPVEGPWPTHAEELWSWEAPWLVQRGALNSFAYRFEEGGLAEIVVTQSGGGALGDTPTLRVQLDAPLPDLRRPFEGEHTRAFTLSLNNQPPHAHGELVVRATDEGAELDLRPLAPDWFASRPMHHTLRFTEDGGATLLCRMEAP